MSESNHLAELQALRAEIETLGTRLAELTTHHPEQSRDVDMFRAVAESAPATIAILVDDRLTYVNPAAVRITGYSREQLLKMRFWDLVHEDDRAKLIERAAARRRGEKVPDRYPMRFRRRDGSLAWVDTTLTTLGTDDGAILAIGFDVTDRFAAEEARRESEARLRSLVMHAPLVISTVGRDRRLRFLNHTLSGRPVAEIIGTCFDDYIHREDLQMVVRSLQSVFETGRPGEFEARYIGPDGAVIGSLHGHVAPIWQDERVTEVVLFGQDVTRLREEEERVAQTQAELQHVQRLGTMGEMATGLAHEVSQPLAAIGSYATACSRLLQAEAPDTPQLIAYLDRIKDQAQRAGSIIHGLRELTRKHKPQRAPVEIGDLVREAIRFIRPEADRQHVELHCRIDGSPGIVEVDRIQVAQVLLNLAKNALEAMESMPAAERRLTIRASRVDPSTVEITVGDSGPGIAPDVAERIFDQFYTTRPEGLGVGLPISRTIIHAHQGQLCFTANPEGGVTFHCTLPAAQETEDA